MRSVKIVKFNKLVQASAKFEIVARLKSAAFNFLNVQSIDKISKSFQ